jgi:hypothetical protein
MIQYRKQFFEQLEEMKRGKNGASKDNAWKH